MGVPYCTILEKWVFPMKVLFKKETLDESDWNLNRKHPVYARELLAPIEYLDMQSTFHTATTRSGMGAGILRLERRGDTLSSPLVRRVDVWDPCCPIVPTVSAARRTGIRVLREKAGTHFDPAAVELFFKVMAEQEPAAKS